ncbi:MAG: carbonic anhydrase family protein [Cyanobacteria bacterium HKST-UBA02]|nr:carbonic anhydrase family protein [Cyanobacteria bacterium HKST-UBA02]
MSSPAPFVLTPDFGTQQSPINIIDNRCFLTKHDAPEFSDEYSDIEVELRGEEGHRYFYVKGSQHVITVMTCGAAPLKATLKKIHFHAPSEHTIDGNYFDAEFHFVHEICKKNNHSGDGQIEPSDLLVVTLLASINSNAPNPLSIKEIANIMLQCAGEEPDDEKHSKVCGELGEFIRDLIDLSKSDSYFYRGSLTSGEYDESVAWLIPKTPAPITEESLKHLTELHIRQSTRSIQPTNRRVILKRAT